MEEGGGAPVAEVVPRELVASGCEEGLCTREVKGGTGGGFTYVDEGFGPVVEVIRDWSPAGSGSWRLAAVKRSEDRSTSAAVMERASERRRR